MLRQGPFQVKSSSRTGGIRKVGGVGGNGSNWICKGEGEEDEEKDS